MVSMTYCSIFCVTFYCKPLCPKQLHVAFSNRSWWHRGKFTCVKRRTLATSAHFCTYSTIGMRSINNNSIYFLGDIIQREHCIYKPNRVQRLLSSYLLELGHRSRAHCGVTVPNFAYSETSLISGLGSSVAHWNKGTVAADPPDIS